MVNEIISTILKDIVTILRKENDFFSLGEKKQKDILEHFNKDYPKPLASYLLNTNGEEFMKDMRNVLFYISESKVSDKSDLLNAIIDYFITDFSDAIDQFNTKRSIPGVYLHNDLKKYFENYTEQEISREIFSFIKSFKDIPLIVIQAPENIKNRAQIRKEFTKKYPFSFVEFQRKDELLGGIKIFVDGEVVDNSWFSKVASLNFVHSN